MSLKTSELEQIIHEASWVHERLNFTDSINPESPCIKETLAYWLDESLLENIENLKNKLSLEKLTYSQFNQIIGESSYDVQFENSEWIDLLKEIHNSDLQYFKWGISPNEESGLTKLAQFIAPFINFCAEWLKKNLLKKSIVVKESFIEAYLNNLAVELQEIALRSLVLEMHIKDLKNELSGNTPEEKMDYFTSVFLKTREYFWVTLTKYPVLARFLATRTVFLQKALLEMIDRLEKDINHIRNSFNLKFSALASLEISLGDTHDKGRKVQILITSEGERVVYKPKDVGMDFYFQELLEYLNENISDIQFKTVKIIKKEKYGWMEFLTHDAEMPAEDIKQFYYKQGGYLALFYLLDANDFHAENILINKKDPMYIDLETLFQPHFHIHSSESANDTADNYIANSVMRTGMLPILAFHDEKQPGVEFSGLGGLQQKATIFMEHFHSYSRQELPAFRDEGFELPTFDNLPRLNQEQVPSYLYIHDIIKGFSEVYLFFEKNKERITYQKPFLKLKSQKIRSVIRSTQHYYNFLQAMYHPDYLKNGADQDMLLDRLYVTQSKYPKHLNIVPSEKADLLNGDIPIFYSMPNSKDLIDSKDRKIQDYFINSGWGNFINRLLGTSTIELEKAEDMIVNAISTNCPVKQIINQFQTEKSNVYSSSKDFITEIAQSINNKAILSSDGNQTTWLGLQKNSFGQWYYDRLSLNYDNGLPSMSLITFLFYKVCKDSKYYDLSTKAHQTILYEYKKQNYKKRELLDLFLYFSQYTILTGDHSTKEIIVNMLRKVEELTSNFTKERHQFEMAVEALVQHEILSKNEINLTLNNRAVKRIFPEPTISVMLDIVHKIQYSRLNINEYFPFCQLEDIEIPSMHHYSSGLAGLLDLYSTLFYLTRNKDYFNKGKVIESQLIKSSSFLLPTPNSMSTYSLSDGILGIAYAIGRFNLLSNEELIPNLIIIK